MGHDELRIWFIAFALLSLFQLLTTVSCASWLSRIYARLDRIPKKTEPHP